MATCLTCNGEGELSEGVECEVCGGEGQCDCGQCEACITEAEAAWERNCEDFYGGSGPLPPIEQQRRAWAQKQGRTYW